MTPKLGETTREQALLGRRDAHHCAAVLVKCGEPALLPGSAVRFQDDARSVVVSADIRDAHGIVDPFLTVPTGSTRLFWVLLLPELVHGLHHDFTIGAPSIGDDSPFDEEDGRARDDEEAEAEIEMNERNSYVGRGRDDDGCSGSWCDGH